MIKAIEKVYSVAGIESESIFDDIKKDYLTLNTCRNGREVVWYMDESKNVAVYVDTLEVLSNEEIEKELC